MVGHFVLLGLGALCLATGGFVGGLTWSARELGVAEHRGFGAATCAICGALGVGCLLIAGAVA